MTTFHTSRLLPYSLGQVFRAFSDPSILATWWGPDGFTNEFERFDFQVGGAWTFFMVGPTGARFWNECVFTTIDPPNRLVIRHSVPPLFTLTVDLTAELDGVRVVWNQTFDDPAVAEAVKPIVVPANEQNLDRLHRALGALQRP